MSNKKYPAIFQPEYDREIKVLVYGEYNGANAIHLDGPHKGVKTNYFADDELKNTTREYLTNTYGKCESQEHADFICKLAENAGFRTINDYSEKTKWFCFNDNLVEFYRGEGAAHHGEKPINLPLPPKENKMSEVKPEKPIYTKEMHERGEYPPIGSKVKLRDGIGVVELGVDSNGFFPVLTNGKYRLLDIGCVKPIPTIEDELIHEFNNHLPLAYCKSLAQDLLTKYNITPKGE